MENVNLTRTNKYLGTNVVDVAGESCFPIGLLYGDGLDPQPSSQPGARPDHQIDHAPADFGANSISEPRCGNQNFFGNSSKIIDPTLEDNRTSGPAHHEPDHQATKKDLAKEDEDEMDFLNDENLEDILEGLDIDEEEDIEDNVDFKDQRRGVGVDRKQQQLHVISNNS